MNPATKPLVAALDEALRQLATTRANDRGIHTARKELKKARATLRLLRPALGEKRYRADNTALRDAGRLLSPLRDAKALLEAFEKFVERGGDDIDVQELRRVRALLRLRLARARKHFHPRSREVTQSRRIIRTHRNRLAGKTVQALPADAVAEGLQRIYRRARKAQQALPKDASAEALHEWRKRVKYLRNATAAVAKPGTEAVEQAEEIGDLLGEDHDLVLLGEALMAKGAESLRLTAVEDTQKRIAKRRAKLQKDARKLGKKLFADKPKRFVKELDLSTGSSRRAPSHS